MTASQIIKAIETLSREEQAKVVQFAYRLDAQRQLSGGELAALAKQMVNAGNPADAALLRASIVQGFYGETSHA